MTCALHAISWTKLDISLNRALIMQTATTSSQLPPADLSATPERVHRLLDYYALIKPRMNLLVLATTAVGYYMASHGPLNWLHLVHSLLGTALLAGGAAVLNQQVERRHDANMNRTARRPIPAGRIGSTEALALGVALAVAGLIELQLWVNPLTAALGSDYVRRLRFRLYAA